jgi:hypothetical protein
MRCLGVESGGTGSREADGGRGRSAVSGEEGTPDGGVVAVLGHVISALMADGAVVSLASYGKTKSWKIVLRDFTTKRYSRSHRKWPFLSDR